MEEFKNLDSYFHMGLLDLVTESGGRFLIGLNPWSVNRTADLHPPPFLVVISCMCLPVGICVKEIHKHF